MPNPSEQREEGAEALAREVKILRGALSEYAESIKASQAEVAVAMTEFKERRQNLVDELAASPEDERGGDEVEIALSQQLAYMRMCADAIQEMRGTLRMTGFRAEEVGAAYRAVSRGHAEGN